MLPSTSPRTRRNSARTNLLISFVFHAVLVVGLGYVAAREGLLGKQLKKIAVELVKEAAPEKPKPAEKPPEPAPEIPKPIAHPVVAREAERAAPPTAPPSVAPPADSPPAVAPPALSVPAFVIEGGKPVETSSDPATLYKGFVEYSLRAQWERPTDLADDSFVAEVAVTIDRDGRVRDPQWTKLSGHARWDASVRKAVAALPALRRPPPAAFPERITVRFDVQETSEAVLP